MNAGFWKGRATLVTGGTGFVGRWLVRTLCEHGAAVYCLIRPRSFTEATHDAGLAAEWIDTGVTVIEGDICSDETLTRILHDYGITTVFHLAAQTSVTVARNEPTLTFDTNIKGTWTLLEACRLSPLVKQVVMASSDKAYGEHGRMPYDEATALHGQYPYDVSKSCADLIAQSYAATYDLPVAIARCANIYGGGDMNWGRIFPGTIRSVLHDERPIIRSDGSFVRDYCYIEDAAAAYMLLAQRLQEDPTISGEAFNFSHEVNVSVLELVRSILAVMDSPLEPEVMNEASSEIRAQYLSATKARTRLGWSPRFDLTQGIGLTIDWYRAYFAKMAVC